MKYIRIFFLILLLLLVLAGAAGFLYLELKASRDISRWLSAALSADVVVRHTGYAWPAGLSFRGVGINDAVQIERVYASARPGDLWRFARAWFKRQETLDLPLELEWQRVYVSVAPVQKGEKGLAGGLQELLRVLESDGSLQAGLVLKREGMRLLRLRFEGEVTEAETR